MQGACERKNIGGKVYRCPFELTLNVIGGKWKLLIVYYLSRQEYLRFGELRRCLPEISERMLVKQLRELEADDLVRRNVFKEVPPRVEYSLTPFGASLMPIVRQLSSWGAEYEQNILKLEHADFKKDSHAAPE